MDRKGMRGDCMQSCAVVDAGTGSQEDREDAVMRNELVEQIRQEAYKLGIADRAAMPHQKNSEGDRTIYE
jgi:hypothetical protein